MDMDEAFNAVTMLPGFLLTSTHAPRTDSVIERLAILSFNVVCMQSMAYHLTPDDDSWKLRMLDADVVAQQLSSLVTLLVTWRRDALWMKAAKLAFLASSSAALMALLRRGGLSSTCRDGALVALQSGIVFVANGFDANAWWLAALVLRCSRFLRLPWVHGVFHLAVMLAFNRMWTKWARDRSNMLITTTRQ